MLLKIVYMLVRRVLGLAVLVFRRDLAKDAELPVLWHENAVLRRHIGRIRYEPADRVWLTALAQVIPRGRRAEIFPVTPATLLAWHRRLAGNKYDTSKRRKPGRPPAIRSIARAAMQYCRRYCDTASCRFRHGPGRRQARARRMPGIPPDVAAR